MGEFPNKATQFDGSTPGPGRPPGSVSLKRLAQEAAKEGDEKKAKQIVKNLLALASHDLETELAKENPNAQIFNSVLSAIKEAKEWFDGKENQKVEIVKADIELWGMFTSHGRDKAEELGVAKEFEIILGSMDFPDEWMK